MQLSSIYATGPYEKYDIKYGANTRLNLIPSKNLIAIKSNNNNSQNKEMKKFSLTQQIGPYKLYKNVEGLDLKEEIKKINSRGSDYQAMSVYHQPQDLNAIWIPKEELYMVFQPSVLKQNCLDIINKESLQVIKDKGANKFIVAPKSPEVNIIKIASDLQKNEMIKTAEPSLATAKALY